MRPDDPRLIRMDQIRLFLFTFRHIVGVALFAWLTLQTKRLEEGPLWLAVGGFGLVYAVFALFSGRNLYQMYRRRQRSVR